MPNPLFNTLGAPVQGVPTPAQLVEEIQNFKRNFKGSPREQVQHLLNTGAMSQQQFNQLSQMATQLLQSLPR